MEGITATNAAMSTLYPKVLLWIRPDHHGIMIFLQVKPDDIEFPEDDEDDKPLRRSRAKKKRKKSDQAGEEEWFEPTGEPKTQQPLDDTGELGDLKVSVGIKRNKDGTPRKKSKDPEFKNGKFKEQKDLFEFPQDPNLRDPSRKFQVWTITQIFLFAFCDQNRGFA